MRAVEKFTKPGCHDALAGLQAGLNNNAPVNRYPCHDRRALRFQDRLAFIILAGVLDDVR